MEDLYQLNRYFDKEKALNVLDKYIAACPDSSSLYFHKARLLSEMKRFDETKNVIEEARKKFPEDKDFAQKEQSLGIRGICTKE